jgi:hypothetical protein
MMGALGSAVGLFIAMSTELAFAQVDETVSDLTREMTWPTGAAAMAGILPPAEILSEVRQEGFYPVGRPVQRGRIYVLFAIDQDDMDVRLTVDGATAGCCGSPAPSPASAARGIMAVARSGGSIRRCRRQTYLSRDRGAVRDSSEPAAYR